MAGSLGSLVVSLGLDAAEFTTGLTKSEYQARKFAQRLDNEIAKGIIKAQLAIEAFGRAVQTAFQKAVVDVGTFKQISEQIGDSAEAVAALDKAAATSGVSLNEIASISARLTATLSKTDEEGDAAALALKALGLSLEEFRNLSPVAQLETLSKAFKQFEDGAGKSAVAIALLGKAGASALPFLNDLADQGGRTTQLTREQIEVIDRYSKELAAMGQEAATFARILASDTIRELVRLREEMRDGIAIAGGLFSALVLFGTISPFRTLTENIRDVRKALDEANETASSGAFYQFLSKLSGGFFERAKVQAQQQLDYLKAQQRREALDLISESNNDARDFKARQKPFLDFRIPGKPDKSKKDQTTEAERYLDTLKKQLQSTQDLTAVEIARMEIAKGLKGITPDLERQIMLYAEMVDFLRNVKREEEERKRIEQEAGQARARNEAAFVKMVDDELKEAEAIRQGNQQIEDQITLLLHGEEALNKVNEARLDSLILLAKEKAFMLQNAEGTELMVQALQGQIAALERRKQLFAETEIAKRIKEEADKLQDLKNNMSDALVQPLVDFVNQTKSAKDAFKDFLNSIQQMLAQKAARTVADYIFGGKTGSGFDFGTLASWLGSLFGGGTGFLPPGAMGPPMFATGTSYAQGGMALVGETGPELVRLPVGARVSSASDTRNTGGAMSITINPPAGMSRQSAQQFAVQVGSEINRRMKRA